MDEQGAGALLAIVRLVEQAFNERDFDALRSLIHPDHVDHNTLPEEAGGLAGFVERLERMQQAFSDVHATVEDVLVDGSRIAWRWTLSGTHTGNFLGIDPTGRSFAMTGMNIDLVRDDRIIETWSYPDRLGLLYQLGVIDPMPPGSRGPTTRA